MSDEKTNAALELLIALAIHSKKNIDIYLEYMLGL